jgi:hypothetical protein
MALPPGVGSKKIPSQRKKNRGRKTLPGMEWLRWPKVAPASPRQLMNCTKSSFVRALRLAHANPWVHQFLYILLSISTTTRRKKRIPIPALSSAFEIYYRGIIRGSVLCFWLRPLEHRKQCRHRRRPPEAARRVLKQHNAVFHKGKQNNSTN